MAIQNWIGTAAKVPQITTIAVTGPVLVGEHWTVTVGNKSTTITGVTTTTAVCNALQAALTVSGRPAEFSELSWVASNPNVIGTATNATTGIPITVAASTDSAGGTIGVSTTQAATGPWHFDNVTNWSTASLPVNSDDIYFGSAENGPKYALDAISGVHPSSVTISPDCSYQLGLPVYNGGGYIEYRPRYVQFDGVSTFYCNTTNSNLIRVNFLSTAFTVAQIDATGSSSADQNAPVLNILGSGATNSLEVNGGSIGVAWFSGETATVKTFQQSGGNVTFGAGCTLNGSGSAMTLQNGTMTANSSLLTVTVVTGNGTIEGIGTITTLTIQPGGRWTQNSSGTITTLNLSSIFDLSQDARPKTITNLNLHVGASIIRNNLLTVTTPVTGSDVRNISCS